MKLTRRLAGISGVLFVVLSAAVVVTAPPIPTLEASGADIVTYYSAHQTGFLIGNYLGALAVVPGFLVLVYLATMIRDAEAGRGSLWILVIVTNATALAAAMTVFVLFQTAAVVAPTAQVSTAKAFSDASNTAFAFSFLPLGAVAGSASWGFLGTGTMPRWLGWSGLVVALLQLVGSLGTVLITGPLAAGGPVTLVSFSALLAWLLVIAILLIVRPAKPTT